MGETSRQGRTYPRVLRRTFVPKWGEGTGGWRQLHISCMICIIHQMLFAWRKSRRIRWTDYIENARKTALGRLRHRLKDNTEIDHYKTSFKGINWIYLRDHWAGSHKHGNERRVDLMYAHVQRMQNVFRDFKRVYVVPVNLFTGLSTIANSTVGISFQQMLVYS